MILKTMVAKSATLSLALIVWHPGPFAMTDRHQEAVDEIFDLNMGAVVSINGLNGPLHVESWAQPKAEIHIIKSTSEAPEELKRLEVIIEHTPGSLDIRTRKPESHDGPRVRVSADLKLPRQMNLSVGGINGVTSIAAVEGPVEISGINGRLRLDQANDKLKISGVNGSVRAALRTLGADGIHISGVNGSIDIALPDSLNADVDVTGHNGSVDANFELAIKGTLRRNEFHARIGSGGTPIHMSGINGSINLLKSSL